ncbi:MAG: nucleotidyltransferase family protein [Treponema sp.]|nr:nucleotidyltransferase family protein [Treponema sp.]
MTDTVFAILLAAGYSRRFGDRNKLLTSFRGKPLVRHTLDLVCGMGCFERIFFIYADEEVAALAREHIAAGHPVTAIYNPSPEKGQGESVRLGTAAANDVEVSGGTATYYFFFPCDQGLLDAATVRLLLNAAQPGCIVEPSCSHSLVSHGSPSLFSAVFRDELLSLAPGEQPRLLKSRHPAAVIQVTVPNPAVLEDIDTPADLERLE